MTRTGAEPERSGYLAADIPAAEATTVAGAAAARTDVSEEVKYYSKLHQRARRRPSLNPSSSTSLNCTRCSTYVNDPDSSPRKEGKTRLADTDQHLAVYGRVGVGGKKSPKKQKKASRSVASITCRVPRLWTSSRFASRLSLTRRLRSYRLRRCQPATTFPLTWWGGRWFKSALSDASYGYNRSSQSTILFTYDF